MKTQNRINTYFAKQNINVSYNTLAATENLCRAFCKEFDKIVDSTKQKKSQHVKDFLYQKLYDFKPRGKLTGFEQLNKIDMHFRASVSNFISDPQWSDTFIFAPFENSIKTSYKTELKTYLGQNFNNSLLYLSGGMDSELVANAMLDARVKFTPVIFEFIGSNGRIYNGADIKFAYAFCSRHGLVPIVKTLNLDELWNSTDFIQLAIDMQIVSPQIVTHAFMIKIMEAQFPGTAHVFGGEVRFYTNHLRDDGRYANLVILDKLTPGYNGGAYEAHGRNDGTGISSTSLSLNYTAGYGVTQTWNIYQQASGTGAFVNNYGSPTSGNWANSSSIIISAYSYRIVSASVTEDCSPGVPSLVPSWQTLTSQTPSSATSWNSISSGTNYVGSVSAQSLPNISGIVGQWIYSRCIYGIEVRASASPLNVLSTTVNLYASNMFPGGMSASVPLPNAAGTAFYNE